MPKSDSDMTLEQEQLRDDWRTAIGKCLKGLRLEANLTQQQLADRSGIDRTTILHLEAGNRSILLDRLIPMLTALMTPPWIFMEMVEAHFDYDWEQLRQPE